MYVYTVKNRLLSLVPLALLSMWYFLSCNCPALMFAKNHTTSQEFKLVLNFEPKMH